LKGEFDFDTLLKVCKALNIETNDADTANSLCYKIQKERPDLMRGKFWNGLRRLSIPAALAMVALPDVAIDHVQLQIPSLLYRSLESWNERYDIKSKWTPFANYEMERKEAYKILGHDPRTKKRSGANF
jgi:hypothetical protein